MIWIDFQHSAPVIAGLLGVWVSKIRVRVRQKENEEQMVSRADAIQEIVTGVIISTLKAESEARGSRVIIALNLGALKIGSELLSELDSLADNLSKSGGHS